MVYTGALQRDYERLNMMTLQEFLEKQFDENLMLAVLSGQRSKEKEAPSKVRIRQIELKGSVCYQASSTVGSKVLHSNYSREEVIAYVEQSLQEGGFSQLQVQGRCKDGSVLVSKKGLMFVIDDQIELVGIGSGIVPFQGIGYDGSHVKHREFATVAAFDFAIGKQLDFVRNGIVRIKLQLQRIDRYVKMCISHAFNIGRYWRFKKPDWCPD